MAIDKKWYVVTGGPSSGKTTTLEELKKRGYDVRPEAARLYIDQEMAKGRLLAEIRKDEFEFQRIVLRLKMDNEKKAPQDKIVFFDRGLPDSIAYYQSMGLDTEDLMKLCQEKTYRKIFFQEQVLFETDYSRTENEKTANLISQLLKKAYEGLGYEVISIPAVAVKKRVDLILDHIKS